MSPGLPAAPSRAADPRRATTPARKAGAGRNAGAADPARLRVAAWPGADNPYQRLLHAALGECGVRAEVLAEPTRSHTLNLLLMPGRLVVARLGGVRILHLHWVFDFVPPWMARSRSTRRAAELWYRLVLSTARLVGLRIVWTAHNVVPHERVFEDDLRARRTLLRHAAGVVAHGPSTLQELGRLGLRAGGPVVIAPHGPYEAWSARPPQRAEARERLGWSPDRPVALFFGRVTRQKGADTLVDEFLGAFPAPGVVPSDGVSQEAPLLVVAGRCTDDALGRLLVRAADGSDGRVQVDLRTLTDEELVYLVTAADVVVLPFRTVTTSGSVLCALSLGTPVIVPDHPVFADLDPAVCTRYRDGADGLRRALHEELRTAGGRPERRAACVAAVAAHPWSEAAHRTAALYRQILDGPAEGGVA